MTEKKALPAHVGIIMDGNGRWAKKRFLPRNLGHRQGAEVFGKIARHAARLGIEALTVYAFSTENWNRPPEEVRGIMDLLRSYLKDASQYTKDNMCLRVLGKRSELDPDIQEQIRDAEERSRNNTGLKLNIALNYGGREEILQAAVAVAKSVQSGEIASLDQIDEERFASYLYTAGLPDVDLVIRTSGEQRISNFLLWQCAYAEYVFVDTLWPDFTSAAFDRALEAYGARTRRMGGI